MPKRISKPRRKVPRLTAAQKNILRLLDACGDAFSLENVSKLYSGVVPLRGNQTTIAAIADAKADKVTEVSLSRLAGGVDVTADIFGYKEYKCNRCGWVHAALPVQAIYEVTEMYLRCFSCKASSGGFVPAEPGDAPKGCTLQPVYVPGAWAK